MFKLSAVILTSAILAACVGDVPQDRAEELEAVGDTSEGPTSLLRLSDTQQRGRRLFETICWTCHGSAGRGDGPVTLAGSVSTPPDFLTGDYPSLSVADLEWRFRGVLAGADDTHPHMRYVTSILDPSSFLDALAFIPALTYPSEIPGSAIAGRETYRFRCLACHGETGRGDGSIGELLEIRPADFTQDTLIAQRDWEAVFQRIREGGQATHSSMPPWGIFFSEAEMWDLVAFISSLQPGVFPSLAEVTSG